MTTLADATLLGSAETFGSLNFGTARLGHIDRNRRLVKSAGLILQHPGGTLPHKFRDPTDLNGFYRLANRKEVTHQAVLGPHRQRTLELMRQAEGAVLTIHDTTELDYTGLTSVTGLGRIGKGTTRGYLCHNTLAVRADDGVVLGLASQILARREDVPEDESRDARRDRSTRESRLWVQGSQAVGPAPEGELWVDVCDRGADVCEYIDYKHKNNGHFIVRSKHDRNCLDGGEPARLHQLARALPPLGCKTVDVSSGEGRPARRARVTIAARAVEIVPPKQPRGDHGQDPIPLRVVAVREVDPPEKVEPLEWIILTDLPAGDLGEAFEVTAWYARRPIVEELHKGMKTGCGIETLQFTTEAALQPAIALLSVVAVFLLTLRDAGRDPVRSAEPAVKYVPRWYMEVLSAWRHGEVRPGWTVREFYLALGRLGGHQNRKGDGAPGWLVLWRGWDALHTMLAGAAAAARVWDRSRRKPPSEVP
jgi:Transposase DNA-binding